MKKIHRYKLDDKHSLTVFRNNSETPYDIFIVAHLSNQNPNSGGLWGTTTKSTLLKQELKQMGLNGIEVYYKQLN